MTGEPSVSNAAELLALLEAGYEVHHVGPAHWQVVRPGHPALTRDVWGQAVKSLVRKGKLPADGPVRKLLA